MCQQAVVLLAVGRPLVSAPARPQPDPCTGSQHVPARGGGLARPIGLYYIIITPCRHTIDFTAGMMESIVESIELFVCFGGSSSGQVLPTATACCAHADPNGQRVS